MHNPFALAVWIIENNTPDACAPFSVLENKKFFFVITKGFTDLSANYDEFSINSVSVKNTAPPYYSITNVKKPWMNQGNTKKPI